MSKIKSIKELEMERAVKPNFGNGISVASGFDLGAKSPLDSRLTVKTLEERNAHVSGNRAYEGMLVFVEADKKTYQLIGNAWEEFGFNDEKFQAGIAPLKAKDTEQDGRLTVLEALVTGGEAGDGSSIIDIVNANKAAIDKEVLDRAAADKVLEGSISKLDSDYKNADIAIKGRLDSLETATGDLEQIRTDIKANTTSIETEATRAKAEEVKINNKVDAEVTRATSVEKGLADRLDILVGEDTVDGSIAKAVKEAKDHSNAQDVITLASAKKYTDDEIIKVNTSSTVLEGRVETLETKASKVDEKIATAKSEAITTAAAHTNTEITKIDTAYKAADVQTLTNAKTYADAEVLKAKTALEGTITSEIEKVNTKVETNKVDIDNLKNAISNKNNNTVVVNTIDEIVVENPNPKAGDIAYVISLKKAYIYKGETKELPLELPTPPIGWVLFDEISTELDLVNYLTKAEASTTYRKLDVKIAKNDLATGLTSEIDAKATKEELTTALTGKATETFVNEKVEAVKTELSKKITEVEGKVSKEVTDRTNEITRVDGRVDTVASDLTTKNNALVAETERLETRISNFVPVLGAVEPANKEAGHVWLEISAPVRKK